jgi:uncharacterized protein YdeI (YjbR/CyaY-like superfamily)
MKEERAESIPMLAFKDRNTWRKWLEKNHRGSITKLWLIIQKKSSAQKSITYNEALEEALCFGWIDSLKRSRDEYSYIQIFSRRKEKSNWSAINKKKIVELEKEGRMHATGRQAVIAAKKNGSWKALDLVEKRVLPPDLIAEFEKYEHAKEHFLSFSKSIQKAHLAWIYSAKKPETREKRVLETAQNAAENKAAISN